jgi:ribosome-binding factor A
MTDRIKRINQLMKERIADILEKEISFDNTLITVQNVDTSKDLKYAKIGISIMPFEKSEEILKFLKKQTLNIQKELNKTIKIKFIPKIKFEIDRGEEKADRIEKILKQI